MGQLLTADALSAGGQECLTEGAGPFFGQTDANWDCPAEIVPLWREKASIGLCCGEISGTFS